MSKKDKQCSTKSYAENNGIGNANLTKVQWWTHNPPEVNYSWSTSDTRAREVNYSWSTSDTRAREVNYSWSTSHTRCVTITNNESWKREEL